MFALRIDLELKHSESYLEIGRACGEHHLVCLARLSVAGEGHVREGLLVPQVLERRDHVGLEIIPTETELLLVALSHFYKFGLAC